MLYSLNAGWDTPGTGMNFLIHNMCRLPGSDGTWMLVRGGMGEVTKRLADAAIKVHFTLFGDYTFITYNSNVILFIFQTLEK